MIIDCHGHASLSGRYFLSADDLVESMDLYGVDQTCISAPVVAGDATPESVREHNDEVLSAMRKYPKRILGYCFVNPGYCQSAQDEIERCVAGGGMIGVKLYHQYRMSEPVQYPIIERCIALGAPILMHAGYSSAPEGRERQPRLSSGEDFALAVRRYPEAMLICAHIGGGGDWEWQLKSLRSAPSVYLDTSGSVIDAGMIERCVRDLGAERLLFGCDMSMERGMGKILGADINRRQRAMILSRNFQAILARRKV